MGTTRSSNSGTATATNVSATTRRSSAAGSASSATSKRPPAVPDKTAASRKTTKQAPQPEPEEDDESEDEYEVEYIVGHKKHKSTGKLKFCLKWKGFPDSDNTWEDEENLNCTELVAKYLRERGLDARGNPLKPSASAAPAPATATSSSSSTAASSSRKRSAVAAAEDANPPAAKRSKTAASSKSSATSTKSQATPDSPGSTPPTSALAMPSSEGVEHLAQLDPTKPWDDLFTIDTIGFNNEGTPELITEHNNNKADPGSLYVFGTTHEGEKVCESLADVRLKAPQRLLDFLIQHLKFRS